MLQRKPYQLEGVEWLLQRDRALLADEAGLGKSVQLLDAATEPLLIVAPAMVLEAGTWDDEIEKWAPGIEATQVSYSSIAKRGARGTVPRDHNGFPLTPLKPEYRGRYGTVILDECHYVKGRKTSWANAVRKLDAARFELATGTPIPNWAQEAFMLLGLMWPEEARPGHRYGSFWRWVNEWFCVSVNPRFGNREIGDLRDAEHVEKCIDCAGKMPVTWDEFRAVNWGDRMIRRLRDDVLDDLPPLTMQEWLVPMKAEQKKAYTALKRDFVTWLDSGAEIAAWSEPGLLVKLAKLTTSLEVLDPTSKPDGKIKVLESLLFDRPSQTLVVAHFQDTIDACVRAARRAGKTALAVRGGLPSLERKEAIRAFQSGGIDVLCASIGTISEGVTLHQGGADQIIRVERSATPSKNEQVVRRLHRMGVERPIHCIDLVCPQSYDSRMQRLLAEKTDQQMRALGEAELRSLV
jgi:SNF2 family DNA or RNA helicase